MRVFLKPKFTWREQYEVFSASLLSDVPKRRAAHKHCFSEINNKAFLWLLFYHKLKQQKSKPAGKRNGIQEWQFCQDCLAMNSFILQFSLTVSVQKQLLYNSHCTHLKLFLNGSFLRRRGTAWHLPTWCLFLAHAISPTLPEALKHTSVLFFRTIFIA